jgi:hypothetical protein
VNKRQTEVRRAVVGDDVARAMQEMDYGAEKLYGDGTFLLWRSMALGDWLTESQR